MTSSGWTIASDLKSSDGRRNASQRIESLDKLVRLGQVFAVGAHLLPDKSHCIQAQHFHALVGQKKHLFRHAVENRRVGVIQIPLIGVESGPYPFSNFFAVGKCAGMLIGKDLTQVRSS